MKKHLLFFALGAVGGYLAYTYVQTLPPWSFAYQAGRAQGLKANA